MIDLETDVPRVVRVDATETAAEFVERGATGVIYPDTIATEHVGDDLEAPLAAEISREEFVDRGRQHFERSSARYSCSHRVAHAILVVPRVGTP